MKYSIIIATYNAEKHLSKAVESLIKEISNSHELIIIDGGSTDKTIDIINKHSKYINYWISEPDKGIYDAWNKGLQIAKGDWIMFLGADDCLNPGALSQYDTFINNDPSHSDLHFISSKIEMVDSQGKSIRIKGWKWEWPKFLNEMTVAHPGALHSRKLFMEYGLFDTKYKITGDYELLLRPRTNLKSGFMNHVTVKMCEGGASDSVAALREHKIAAINTGGNSVFSSNFNYYKTFLKFRLRKLFRGVGLNFYLKR